MLIRFGSPLTPIPTTMPTFATTGPGPHKIPNPLVLETGQAFDAGYTYMMAATPSTPVLLPALHCAFVALELYLKSLSAREVEVKNASTLGYTFIHAQTGANIHRLGKLFDLAPEIFQHAIDAEFKTWPQLRGFADARSALESHNAMFMGSRYPFEAGQKLSGIEINALRATLDALLKGIRSIPPIFVE
jgi:hypothetical protein